MILRLFLMYIGVFFAGAMTFFFIAKGFADQFGGDTKKPLLLGGLSAIGASVLAYLATYFFTIHLFGIYWIFAGIFLLFGIIHVVWFHDRYFTYNDYNKGKIILGEIMYMLSILFFVIVVFSCLEYFFKNAKFLFLPTMLSMFAYFIPLAIYYTFDAAYKIPSPLFPVWEYPSIPIELPDEKPNEKLLVIAFEISKKPSDKARTNFRAKGPETMKLGDLYYHFINDYNDAQSETPILYDGNEWLFRIKPKLFGSQRVFDPELTVRENKIRENTIIICERI